MSTITNPICPKCQKSKWKVKVFQWEEALIDDDYIVQDTKEPDRKFFEIDQDSLECAACGFYPIMMQIPEEQPN